MTEPVPSLSRQSAPILDAADAMAQAIHELKMYGDGRSQWDTLEIARSKYLRLRALEETQGVMSKDPIPAAHLTRATGYVKARGWADRRALDEKDGNPS